MELKATIFQKREPAGSAELFSCFRKIIEIFGQNHCDFVIEKSNELDRTQIETRMIEVDATLVLGEVVSALSLMTHWLEEIPDHYPVIEEKVKQITQHFSDDPEVLLEASNIYLAQGNTREFICPG